MPSRKNGANVVKNHAIVAPVRASSSSKTRAEVVRGAKLSALRTEVAKAIQVEITRLKAQNALSDFFSNLFTFFSREPAAELSERVESPSVGAQPQTSFWRSFFTAVVDWFKGDSSVRKEKIGALNALNREVAPDNFKMPSTGQEINEEIDRIERVLKSAFPPAKEANKQPNKSTESKYAPLYAHQSKISAWKGKQTDTVSHLRTNIEAAVLNSEQAASDASRPTKK